MAKRTAARRTKPVKKAKKTTAKRPSTRPVAAKKAWKATKKGKAKKASKKAAPARKAPPKADARAKARPKVQAPAKTAAKLPRLDRARKILNEHETHDTPPSSLDMGESLSSAARSGRAGMEHSQRDHQGMSDVTAGDPDVDVEDAYFTGEEAPGGDNPTPDQDIVEDIGKALGVTYNDNEELKGADKLVERDKHRWELDPASSDDFKDRD